MNIGVLILLATVGVASCWNILEAGVFKDGFDLLKPILPENETSDCLQHLTEYYEALDNLNANNSWALNMLDATAKIPEGVLQGTLNDFGNFDECLAVVSASENFTGKHCMLDIKAPESFNATYDIVFSYGICLPSSCKAENLNEWFANEKLAAYVNITAYDHSCYTREVEDWSPGSWAFISCTIVLVVIAGISTLYELYQKFIKKNVKPNRLLSAFSIYSNTIGLLEIRDSSGDLACLHGMRTLSMMWVVLGHTYEGREKAPLINLIDEKRLRGPGSIAYVMITNGLPSVDTFLFLSGLLVAFVFFRNISRTGYFDVPVSYIHRYLRLTPAFLAIMIFYMTLYGEMDRGPIYYKQTLIDVKTCQDNWWSSAIYLQNYLRPQRSCIEQSWYMPVDMQLYWISPIILYPLYLWPKIGIAFLTLLTLASTGWTFGLGYMNGFRASVILDMIGDQFPYDYVATHCRMAPWLVGVALGYVICVIKSKKINVRLSKVTVVLGWLFSTGVCLGCLYGIRRFEDDTTGSVTDVEHAAFLAFKRLGWGFGLAWVVFACVYGYGGIANTFLSMGIFQPLGKLSYNVYLLHITFLSYRIAISKTNGYYTDLDATYEFLGTLVISNLFAAVIYLLIEAPIAILDKELLGSIKILPYPKVMKEAKTDVRETHNS